MRSRGISNGSLLAAVGLLIFGVLTLFPLAAQAQRSIADPAFERGDTLYARADTPIHSILHEACHWICMPPERRAALHTDARGDDLEECAVNYLQVLLADELPGYSRARIFSDMDAWGYSFRLGSARAWFERDAEDARAWLRHRGLLDIRHSVQGA